MKAEGAIGCFGEVLLRLSAPLGSKLANFSRLTAHCAGAEANVGAMLAQLGHNAEIFTVLPASPLGDLCEAELRKTRLSTGRSIRAEGRLGLYFFESGVGERGGRIVYDRADSAFACHADAFEWAATAKGLRWFHLSGINLALGGKPAAAALAAVDAMRSNGVSISFDVNHRSSLWQGRAPGEFAQVRDIAANAEVLFASPADLSRVLNTDFGDDSGRAAQAAFAEFPNLQMLASTCRRPEGGTQRLSARVETRTGGFTTDEAILGTVVDRIGSGDAFAAGVIDAHLRQDSPEQTARQALAAAVMKHGISGDRWIGTRDELEAFDPFGSEDVRR